MGQKPAQESIQRSDRPIGPVPSASTLLGGAIAMVIAGLAARCDELFTGHAASTVPVTGAVAGVALMTLAIGVRVPQRVTVWVCTMAWRRFVSQGIASDMSRVLLSSGRADRPLYWVVLSVIALAAGVLTAFLPLNVRLAGFFYKWMHAHFVWSVGPLALLEAVTVFLAGLAPLTLLGLAVSCVHQLSCPYGRWNTRPTAWLLMGASGGLVVATGIAQAASRNDLTLIVAALPVLFLSLVSALSGRVGTAHHNRSTTETWVGSAHPTPEPRASARAEIPLPTCSDRWPRLLRIGIVTAGGAGACVLSVWVAHLAESAEQAAIFAAVMLFAAGIGCLAGDRPRRAVPPSLGGFGMAGAVAGVVVAVGTVGLTGAVPLAVGIPTLLACSGLAAIGLATAYGRQALLRRVASRSAAGATVLSRILVCAGLIVCVGAPVAQRLLGKPATLMVLALALLTLGTALILCEPIRSSRQMEHRTDRSIPDP